jgi:hypothetical protein
MMTGIGLISYLVIPDDLKNKLLAMIPGEFTVFTVKNPVSKKIKEATNYVQEKIDSVILSPEKQREKLLTKLETNLSQLPKETLPPAVQQIIKETEILVEKIKEKNSDDGLVQTAVQKILNKNDCPTQ